MKVMLGAARNLGAHFFFFPYTGKISFLHERMVKHIFIRQGMQPFFSLSPTPLRFFQTVCCYPSHKTASKVAFKERKLQKINC